MPVTGQLLPGVKVFTPYEVANSLRFNSGSSDRLTRSFSAGSSTLWTWSGWIKRSKLGSRQIIFSAYNSSTYYTTMEFTANDELKFNDENNNNTNGRIQSTAKYRDPSAWMHIVFHWDSSDSTSSDRLRMYVNNVRVTDFSDTGNAPSTGSQVNTAITHEIGSMNNSNFFEGYMCEVVFINGANLDPDQFGEFDEDTGIWKPIDVSGSTFGTTGFYLDFKDSSSLGNDVSGNNNDWTVSNLTSIDQTTDTCSNNFMTLNPLSTDSGVTLSEGNTESDFDASVGNAKGNIGLTKGRWYWEVKLTNSTSGYPMIGIGSMNESQMQKPTGGSYPGGFSNSYGVYGTNLRLYANGSNLGDQGSSYTTGDVFGIYLDLESSTKTIKWYKNGSSVLSYNITNAGDDYPFTCMDYNGGESSVNVNYNFGNPAYTISSGNSDDNGYGNFEYSPNISSTKYYAVCTKNLAEFG